MLNDEAAEVLAFWFGKVKPRQRFARSDTLDAEIASRFGTLHARLTREVPDDWLDNPEDLLAAVIVLDQFSRNLYRDDPRAYANDPIALNLARLALHRGYDELLGKDERHFLYLPFLHSEDADDQDRGLELMEEIGDAEAIDYARRYKAIIDRFGRFPHRNAVLGRQSTPEEVEFLGQPESRS
jgi:uncharacterized protein (DUF924 family)